ncbi:non-specific lipid-transfer protein 13-like [Fagus crenata]
MARSIGFLIVLLLVVSGFDMAHMYVYDPGCDRVYQYFPYCLDFLDTVKGLQPPVIASNIQALPSKCHTNLSFPISESIDCTNFKVDFKTHIVNHSIV